MDIRKSLDSSEEMSIERAEETVEMDSETLRYRTPPVSAVRVNDEIGDRVKQAMNTLRKSFAENGAMDRLKEIFEDEIRKKDFHKENIEKLHQILSSSSDQISYEEAFKELGGPTFRVSDDDDLDAILRKLVKENNIALPEEELKILFEKWDRELKK